MECARHFRIACLTSLDSAIDDVVRLRPAVVCIDFDKPDQLRLQGVLALKRAHARVPLLLLTREHSEALAIWALRLRAWNYFVKPVPIGEFSATVALLAHFAHPTSLARTVYRLDPEVPRELAPTPVEPRTARLLPALQYVLQNFSTKLSAEEAAALCGMGKFTFSRNFHATFGMTFREHVMLVRLAEARRLILEGGHSLTSVAYASGFNDTSYFTRMFRRHCGTLPSQYREASDTNPPRAPSDPTAEAGGPILPPGAAIA